MAKLQCGEFSKTGHFSKFCRSKDIKSKDQAEDNVKADMIEMNGLQLFSSRLSKKGSCGLQPNERVKLPNEEYVESTKKFEARPAKPSPKIEITIRVDVDAYHTHQPRLQCKVFEKFLSGSSIMPSKVIAITDTGAQANVMGEKHLKDIGMDRFSLYPTTVTMDCPNNMRLKARLRSDHLFEYFIFQVC